MLQRLFIILFIISTGGCQGDGTHVLKDPPDLGPDLPNYSIIDWGAAPETRYHTDAKCARLETKVELLPLDMLIALDTSYSMDFKAKWPSVKEAIKVFTTDPRFTGLGVGIQYFPLRKQCSVEDYAAPAVPITVLPGVGPSINDSLDLQRMFGGTPMVPMLEGALQYTRGIAGQNANRKVVVIIATDGIPDNTCTAPDLASRPNTLANVVTLAGEGLSGSPSISTFAIGVGQELTALNQISQAGSGSDAILVDADQDIKAAFIQALDTIRRRALSCEHEIPEPEKGEIDYDYVNVEFTTEGETETFLRVSEEGECQFAMDNGWYYDNPLAPTKIVLCDGACDKVQTSANGIFNVIFGCASIIY